MEPTEKEIEVRLRELGIRLASPPRDVGELLYLLDQTEIYLSRVEQSPSASMFDAMRPAMNSLIVKEFLSHSDTDVKVFVAACFNEIIRITAPDAPYDDALMKEIFALIVDAFKKLDDLSGCSYSKRVSILEIMANVCSCVVMLDLECDDLILQMFKILLSSIRPNHPINVFSSMEVIMTLILEESEDISQELALCLLSNVQKSKKGVMPVTCELAKKVIHNCATKLKPYFLVAVQTMDISLNDYCGIVAAICQERPVTLEQNKLGGNKLSEKAVSDELPQKVDKPGSCLEEVGTSADKTKIALSNGGILLGNENPAVESIFPESQPNISFSSEQCRNDRVPRAENNDFVFVTEKSGNEQNLQYKKVRLSSAQLEDASDSSWVDGDKESFDPTVRRTCLKKQTARSLESDNVSDKAPITEVLVESEKDAEVQPLECIADDYTCANSVSPSCGSPGIGLPIRRQITNSQFNEIKGASNKPSASLGKEKMQIITLTEKGDSPAIVFNNKNNCSVSILNGKSSNDSDKTSYENNAMADVAADGTGDGKSLRNEQKGTSSVIVVDKNPLEDNATVDVIAAGISDGKSLRNEQKEVSSVVSNANSFRNQWQFNKNQAMDKDATKEVESADPCLKEMIASANTSGEANNDQNVWVKLGDVERCREANRKYNIYLEIIGRKIEVWWPDDMMFYNGVIDAFDPMTKKHRVLYDDGDEEILFLKTERWNYIDSDNFEGGQENYIAGAESTLQVTKEIARVSSRKSKATRKRGRFGRRKFFLNPIEQHSLSKFKKWTSEAATSLNVKAPNDPPLDEAVSDVKSGERFISPPGNSVSDQGAEFEPDRTNESANQGTSEDAGAPKLGETSKSKSLDGETLRKDVGIQVEISQAAACSYDTSVVSMASDGLKIRWKRKRIDGGIIDASVSTYKSCEGKDMNG